ncbi:MAG: uroporphyrinogen-III C-methyltransferase [Acetobacteraceae bacterium]
MSPLDAVMRDLPVLPPGHVWLAGAGPGDPGMLTMHALSALGQTDALVHDALVDPRVLDLAQPGAERIFAGKRGGKPSEDQADITARLVTLARAGRRVLRLKGGDPFVFGRGGEEALALAAQGIPFRIIPGITAGLGALTSALIPATLRGTNQAVLLVTGHGAELPGKTLDWAALARLDQPIVLYMAITHIEAIAAALIGGGLAPETPAAAIANATLPGERVLVSTVRHLAADLVRHAMQPPTIIVIGRNVAARGRLLALIEEARPWPHAG